MPEKEYQNRVLKVQGKTSFVTAFIIELPNGTQYLRDTRGFSWKRLSPEVTKALSDAEYWDIREISHLELLLQVNTTREQAERIQYYAATNNRQGNIDV